MNDGVIESEHREIDELNGVKTCLNILLLNKRKEIINNYFKKFFKYIIFFIQFYHLNLFKL